MRSRAGNTLDDCKTESAALKRRGEVAMNGLEPKDPKRHLFTVTVDRVLRMLEWRYQRKRVDTEQIAADATRIAIEATNKPNPIHVDKVMAYATKTADRMVIEELEKSENSKVTNSNDYTDHDLAYSSEHTDPENDTITRIRNQEIARIITNELLAIDNRVVSKLDKACFISRCSDGLTYREIAITYGITADEAEKKVARIVRILRNKSAIKKIEKEINP